MKQNEARWRCDADGCEEASDGRDSEDTRNVPKSCSPGVLESSPPSDPSELPEVVRKVSQEQRDSAKVRPASINFVLVRLELG